jgi:hypothetical protein
MGKATPRLKGKEQSINPKLKSRVLEKASLIKTGP